MEGFVDLFSDGIDLAFDLFEIYDSNKPGSKSINPSPVIQHTGAVYCENGYNIWKTTEQEV